MSGYLFILIERCRLVFIVVGSRRESAAFRKGQRHGAVTWRVQDKGLFKGKLRAMRPDWNDDRLEKEWAYLLSTTDESEKEWGGPADSPLQLPIPPYMIGEQSTMSELDTFETRQVVSESKAVKMDQKEALALCF